LSESRFAEFTGFSRLKQNHRLISSFNPENLVNPDSDKKILSIRVIRLIRFQNGNTATDTDIIAIIWNSSTPSGSYGSFVVTGFASSTFFEGGNVNKINNQSLRTWM